MSDAFLGAGADEVARRVEAAVRGAAGAAVVVHVSAEAHGFRNVGVELPLCGRSVAERRTLRGRTREALERAGVTLAQNAITPRVTGELRGSVRVRDLQASTGDSSALLRGAGTAPR
jgi:hypothetical protein